MRLSKKHHQSLNKEEAIFQKVEIIDSTVGEVLESNVNGKRVISSFVEMAGLLEEDEDSDDGGDKDS